MKSDEDKYLAGKANFGIRMYFYLNSGVSIVNDFRNLFLGIFALYFTLKLDNPLWIIAFLVVSVPILIIAGWYNVHKISKVREWLNIKFGTHYTIKQFDLSKRQVQLLEKILKKLVDNHK